MVLQDQGLPFPLPALPKEHCQLSKGGWCGGYWEQVCRWPGRTGVPLGALSRHLRMGRQRGGAPLGYVRKALQAGPAPTGVSHPRLTLPAAWAQPPVPTKPAPRGSKECPNKCSNVGMCHYDFGARAGGL